MHKFKSKKTLILYSPIAKKTLLECSSEGKKIFPTKAKQKLPLPCCATRLLAHLPQRSTVCRKHLRRGVGEKRVSPSSHRAGQNFPPSFPTLLNLSQSCFCRHSDRPAEAAEGGHLRKHLLSRRRCRCERGWWKGGKAAGINFQGCSLSKLMGG